mgnify:CR=1 FL=1
MKIAIRLLVACALACALAHALAACGQGIFPNQQGLYANLPQNPQLRGRFGSPMAGPAGAVAAGMNLNGGGGGFVFAPPEAGTSMYNRTSYDSNFHQPPPTTFLVNGGGGTVGGTPPQSGQVVPPSEPAASRGDVERLRNAARALLRQQGALDERLRDLERQRTPRRQR